MDMKSLETNLEALASRLELPFDTVVKSLHALVNRAMGAMPHELPQVRSEILDAARSVDPALPPDAPKVAGL